MEKVMIEILVPFLVSLTGLKPTMYSTFIGFDGRARTNPHNLSVFVSKSSGVHPADYMDKIEEFIKAHSLNASVFVGWTTSRHMTEPNAGWEIVIAPVKRQSEIVNLHGQFVPTGSTTTEKVVDQIDAWESRYGVSIKFADDYRLDVFFKKIPRDRVELERLMMEIYELNPEIFDSDDLVQVDGSTRINMNSVFVRNFVQNGFVEFEWS